MIGILAVLSCGVLFGWLLRNQPRLHQLNNHLLNWSIYILLFLLGISVGTNEEVIRNLGKIGYEAISIAVASIAGSVFLSMLLFRILFKPK